MFTWHVAITILGSLGNNGSNGYKKISLKKWICAASNFIALILFCLICQMLAIFLELNSKGLYQSSGKEKESCCLVFLSLTKREIRHFHAVVVQLQQRNVQKSMMHVQSCCFTTINLLLFCHSSCRYCCLSSLFCTHLLLRRSHVDFSNNQSKCTGVLACSCL